MTQQRSDDGAAHTMIPGLPTHESNWKRALEDGLPRLREQRRWTQADLADASGLHRETISRWERPGRHSVPSDHTLRALALAFNHDDIVAFWTALCSAATTTQGGSWMRLSPRQQQLVATFAALTEVQQELVELLVLLFRTRVQDSVQGEEALGDVEALLALAKQRPRR